MSMLKNDAQKNVRQMKFDKNVYDNMTSAALEAILQADFEASEDEQLDAEAVLYIADLLAERENRPHRDVAAAKADFDKYYLPQVVREEQTKPKNFLGQKHNAWHILQRIGGLAAVFLVFVMFSGTVTAYALGYNPLVTTYDLDGQNTLEYSLETADMIDFMKKCGEVGMVPQWLPEGYKANKNTVSTIGDTNKNYASHFYRVADEPPYEVEDIFVNFSGGMTNSNYLHSLYERGFGHIVLYQQHGVDFYIMGIDSRRTIFWQADGLYCRVIGPLTLEEAKKVVDSIYY